MEEQLKQRLVGTAVLALLAVIFLPMILKGPEVPRTGPSSSATSAIGTSLERSAQPVAEGGPREPLHASRGERFGSGSVGVLLPGGDIPLGAENDPAQRMPGAETASNRAMPSRGGAYESRLRGADDLTRARPPSRSGDGSRPAVLNDDGRAASSAPIATPPVATASANRAVEAATSTSPRPVATGAASGAASRPAADSAASRPASSGRPASNGGTTSTTPATASPAAAAAAAAPAPVGPWLVQLASFSNQANAQNLVARLRSDRFDAFARSVQIKGHTVYRVFVGPIKERAEADRLQKRLSDATRLKAIVVAAG